jgi:3-hydroxy-9,10-secoandrosta-1,3,5(10)-triene-9,17-dione monooxygenase reductase component
MMVLPACFFVKPCGPGFSLRPEASRLRYARRQSSLVCCPRSLLNQNALSQPASRTLRRALGAFATGVTVVTARGHGGDVGVTANSFSSVSLDPPMVLWSLRKASSSLSAFTDSGAFVVHILGAHQQALSDRFARTSDDKYAGLSLTRGFGGAPLLDDCAARFQCRLAFQYDGGDHVILVGEVVDFEHSDHPPLLFHGGRYSAIATPAAGSAGDDAGEAGELLELIGRAYHGLFRRSREEFMRRGLSEEAFFVLRILGREEGITADSIAQILARGARRLTPEVLAELERRHLIESADTGRIRATGEGRRLLVELTAVRLSSEQAALAKFDRSESAAIKDLLRRLMPQ